MRKISRDEDGSEMLLRLLAARAVWHGERAPTVQRGHPPQSRQPVILSVARQRHWVSSGGWDSVWLA